ncbi:hypothetical protein OIDMADRAFT_61853 [Oidiodendron maius Zn]|uniref:Uncharacterized protein n=1 Tax=Oidiodendron maius (strain Zn) TaxID=913774 RepID=A0A0C3GP84_OIDMZ|nr:hypothetical protein OIDMADRAFT_61853 [Oidiodendron maius Zn]
MSNIEDRFSLKRFTLETRPSRRPNSHPPPPVSALRSVPETRDWHVTPVQKQPLGRLTPGRQPQFNPNTLPLSPVRQHQGAVSYPEFNKIYLALKQLQEDHNRVEEAIKDQQDVYQTVMRNHERLFAAMEEIANWVRQLCQGFGITDAPRNVPIMGGENQAEETPVYENLLGVKYENSAESNYQDMVDWSMPGGEGLP